MATARCELGLSSLILEPTRRHGDRTVAGENGIDLGHMGVADLPAERTQVFPRFGRRAETDQCRADDRVAQSPAQCELRQSLAVLGLQSFQILDGGQIARELLGSEQGAEQVEAAEVAGLQRSPCPSKCTQVGQAAIRAGYSAKTARVVGCRNITKANIAAEIEKAQRKRAEVGHVGAAILRSSSITQSAVNSAR